MRLFDHSAQEDLLEAYRRATRLILDVFVRHALAGDEADYGSLTESIAEAITVLSSHPEPADVLVSAGTAAKSIEEYNRRTVNFVRARGLELQAMVQMLTQTMSDVSAGSERSITRLRTIERRLAKSQELYDIRDLRQQMAGCLAEVREEAACRKKESEQTLADLRGVIHPAGKRAPPAAALPAPPPDAAAAQAAQLPTGALQSSKTVETLLERAALDGRPLFAAVLAVDRLHAIDTRFGGEAADLVTAFCAEELGKSLQHALLALTWKRGACVVLLDGAVGVEDLEQEILHDSLRRRQMTLETGTRSLMLTVSYSKWGLYPIAGRPVAQLMDAMQDFLSHPQLVHHR